RGERVDTDHRVAMVSKPGRHVGAHLAESDHADAHGRLRFVHRMELRAWRSSGEVGIDVTAISPYRRGHMRIGRRTRRGPDGVRASSTNSLPAAARACGSGFEDVRSERLLLLAGKDDRG